MMAASIGIQAWCVTELRRTIPWRACADVKDRVDQSGQQDRIEAERRCGADEPPEEEYLQHRSPAAFEGEITCHVVVEEGAIELARQVDWRPILGAVVKWRFDLVGLREAAHGALPCDDAVGS
jgi:hypothetical protein